jgi:hypothetical protein
VNDNEALTNRQLKVIPHLLAASSLEEGCRNAGVNKTTVYAWLKEETFREALRRQREEVVSEAMERLKAGVNRAVAKLLGLLESEKETIQARAAEDVIEFAQRAIEHEELEKRVAALEELMRERRNSR